MNFQEATRRFRELKRQYEAGHLTSDQFAEQRERLKVQDDQGRWWAKGRGEDDWYYHDGNDWIRGAPPDHVLPPVSTSDNGKWRLPINLRWVIVGVASFIVLAPIVIIVVRAALPSSAPVPDLVGETERSAEAIAGDDFEISVRSEEVNSKPQGTIFSQVPELGEQAQLGSPIYVDVSVGEPSNRGDIFYDFFSDTSREWSVDENENDLVGSRYANGGYLVFNPDGSWPVLINKAGTDIEDAIVEMDSYTSSTSSDALWGIICRARDLDNYYMMGVSGNDDAWIFKKKDGIWRRLLDPRDASNALREGATNQIRGDCVGSTLTLYVNGQQVAEAEDEEFDSGRVGLYAQFVQEGEVFFDNFLVSTP